MGCIQQHILGVHISLINTGIQTNHSEFLHTDGIGSRVVAGGWSYDRSNAIEIFSGHGTTNASLAGTHGTTSELVNLVGWQIQLCWGLINNKQTWQLLAYSWSWSLQGNIVCLEHEFACKRREDHSNCILAQAWMQWLQLASTGVVYTSVYKHICLVRWELESH